MSSTLSRLALGERMLALRAPLANGCRFAVERIRLADGRIGIRRRCRLLLLDRLAKLDGAGCVSTASAEAASRGDARQSRRSSRHCRIRHSWPPARMQRSRCRIPSDPHARCCSRSPVPHQSTADAHGRRVSMAVVHAEPMGGERRRVAHRRCGQAKRSHVRLLLGEEIGLGRRGGDGGCRAKRIKVVHIEGGCFGVSGGNDDATAAQVAAGALLGSCRGTCDDSNKC